MVLGAGEFVGPLGAEQVGAGGGADDEGSAGEDAQLPRAVQQEEGQVLVGVSGGGQGPQCQPAQVGLVAVGERGVREGAVSGGGGQDGRAVVGGELERAGEEVGVQVGVGGVRDAQPAPLGGRAQGAQIPARVHRQGASVAQVDEVGAVAQPLVDQRYQVIVGEAHQVLLLSR